MFNGGMYNAPLFNGSNYAIQDAKTYWPDQPYVLHLRDNSGTFLRKVEGILSGQWSEKINAPGHLKFTIALDGDLAQTDDFNYPNRVWLHDSALEKLGEFVIVKTEIDSIRGTFYVECAGLLYLLSQEFAVLRNVAGTQFTTQGRITSILANQDGPNPITLGYMAPKYIDAEFTQGYKSDKTIMQALMDAWQQLGGVLRIDNYNRLQWLDDELGDPTAAKMSLYDDIDEYSETVDSDNIINRVYTDANIGFTGHSRTGLGVSYIENTASQALYGIRSAKVKINAEDPTEVAAIALAHLNYFKDPKTVRKISAIDLARVQLDPENPAVPNTEYIWAGAKIKVQPPSNVPGASVFDAMITSVNRNLLDVVDAQITISDAGAMPGAGLGRVIRGTETEFFDILAEELEESDSDTETLHEQDEDIWDYVTDLELDIPDVETSGTEIKPVATTAVVGTNTTEFAPSDHQHEGIPPLIYDSSWTQQSDLGNPQEISLGYLDSGAGDDEGLWFYPPDGTLNSDWKPINYYA